MRTVTRMKPILLSVVMTVCFAGAVARAQLAPAASPRPRPELALGYEFVHSNAPAGYCACFNMNGGSATFAWPLGTGKFALVGDIGVTHAGAISAQNYNLTLGTYTAGVRYNPRFSHFRLKPYGQVLVGFAHSSGSLVGGQSGDASTAGSAFASNVGGGLDLGLTRRFSLRLIEADYLATTFSNSVNDHQNNLRLGAGVVVRF